VVEELRIDEREVVEELRIDERASIGAHVHDVARGGKVD
jgi:hypothetical protein